MNAESRSSEALLPFESFLNDLRRQGFHIGVEHHLRLRLLLNRVAEDCDPAELKTLLCPVFATNAEQQEFFYRTFDTYYPFLQVAGPEGTGFDSLPVRSEVRPPRRLIRRWPYLAAAVVAVALSVAFLTWKTRALRQPATHPDTPPAAGPKVPQRPADVPNTQQRSSTPEQSPRIISRVTRIPPSVSPKLAWYSDQRIALGWTAVMGPVLFWLFYEVYRYRRRLLLIRKALGKVPPYSWPIRTDLAPEIYPPQDLATVSRLLHRRYQGETERLDVTATVEASIAALGFPTFRYRKDSRLPEYLFLIDRAGFRDHQARLHEHLAAMLNGQGLYVSVYFYEGDPRICWNSTGDESVSLDQLQRMCPGYRLLLFGDGDQLLDAVSGRLVHWHRLLTAWADRALLTTEPPSQWGLREMTLATQFDIAPATLDGLASVATYFELPSSFDLRAGKDSAGAASTGSAGIVDALRLYLGAEAFQWLCACAIYPELQWDLTLRIGALPSLTPGLISEENLVRLLRLEWFRTGSMPDDLRRDLLSHLDARVQREVREAIIGLLETNPPPRDTFAASAHQFQIAFQRYWTHPRDRQARSELKAALENVSPDELAQDYAYLDAVESVSQSPLQLLLPSRLRKLVFPAGASWFGMRSGARLVLLAAAILGSLQILRQVDKHFAAETARYSAELSKGLGLSIAEANGRVRISWSTKTPALRTARSGALTIADGGKVLQLPLGREELNAGSAEYPPVSGNLSVKLAVTDDVQNKIAEQTAYQLSRRPSIQEAEAAKAQTGSISIAGKTFRPPKTTNSAAHLQIDAPPPIMPDASANQAGNIVDRVLTSTGVLPPFDQSAKLNNLADGKTYALLIGISKYAKPELSLHFADADANSMAQFLESPRGGSVPADQLLLLTNEKATTAAVRHSFQDFLKRRATRNDTVLILLVAHSTVEVPGSKNAYILTYDSDPQDLKSTALPMADLLPLFGEQVAKVGRVLLFVDVCKAGTIGTIHNTTIATDVSHLGDVPGDLFGLVASRPKEVSFEGPEFGGGHGAFSYYVVKGLEGAADANGDGVVDANELIRYVINQVPGATGNKQHPREFGTYDPSMRLSDVKKPSPAH